ncbi:SDR family oxidoreductase [Mycolicibacterium farcinogenes]|uniref:SDR family NAD(P)-dependent oxidoreductase n=1 Tax=Mycolicibacterium farcinogenes TaxID=1802 RepID=UPI001C8EDE57|nr:SDR family NAD(P)-dependent oxidoreductase [Mycolicibacterium farcinogenes]QZH60922.1 SDR family oxidoreductase [Mycolicibacterium farcinogenes]
MSTIAIVGAGSGMGLAIAKVFGAKGFQVALLARNSANLDHLVSELAEDGISAAGFAADVTDREGLTRALQNAAEHFGGIDVLEYSPAVHTPSAGFQPVSPSQCTAEDLQPHIDYYVYGAMAAARAVLPGMVDARSGTLLFTTGGGSVNPVPMLGNINAAHAALRNWALNLHNELSDTGVYAAHVAIGAWIGDGGPEGFPSATTDQIAPIYWELHSTRQAAEHIFTA